jgi:hypothetical protein
LFLNIVMRRTLTFEAIVEPPGGTLLLQIATLLRDQQLDPESLTWSWAPRGNVVKVRLTLRASDARHMHSVSTQLRVTPEVINVTVCDLNGLPAPGSTPPITPPAAEARRDS